MPRLGRKRKGEAFHPFIRLEQAKELIAERGPIGSASAPVILAGDLNGGPELPVADNRLAFQALVDHRLVDTWAVPGDPGYNGRLQRALERSVSGGCPAAPDRPRHGLRNVGVVASRIYGTDPDNRTASGTWPSDHAGVQRP